MQSLVSPDFAEVGWKTQSAKYMTNFCIALGCHGILLARYLSRPKRHPSPNARVNLQANAPSAYMDLLDYAKCFSNVAYLALLGSAELSVWIFVVCSLGSARVREANRERQSAETGQKGTCCLLSTFAMLSHLFTNATLIFELRPLQTHIHCPSRANEDAHQRSWGYLARVSTWTTTPERETAMLGGLGTMLIQKKFLHDSNSPYPWQPVRLEHPLIKAMRIHLWMLGWTFKSHLSCIVKPPTTT